MTIHLVFSQLRVIPFITLSFTISCRISFIFLYLPSSRILRATPPLWNSDRTFRSHRFVLPLKLNKFIKTHILVLWYLPFFRICSILFSIRIQAVWSQYSFYVILFSQQFKLIFLMYFIKSLCIVCEGKVFFLHLQCSYKNKNRYLRRRHYYSVGAKIMT